MGSEQKFSQEVMSNERIRPWLMDHTSVFLIPRLDLYDGNKKEPPQYHSSSPLALITGMKII